MKFFTAIFLFFFFSFFQEDFYDQEDFPDQNDINYTSFIKKKPPNYFELDEEIKNLSLKEMKEFYKQSKNKNYIIGEICALNCIGRYHRKKNENNLALKNHQKALAIASENNLEDIEVATLNHIGVVYRINDDIRNALDFHQSAISKAKKIKSPTVNTKINISKADNSLGNIYLSLQQYEKAIEQFNKAIELQRETQNLLGLAINFQNIGEAFENLSFYDKAMENYKKSLEYNYDIKSTYGKVICSNSISSILIKKGKYKEALRTIDTVLPYAKTINSPNYLAQTYSNLGWVQLRMKNYEQALPNLHKALAITEGNTIRKSNHVNICFHLSEYFQKTNNYKKAYEFYQKAVEIEKKTLGLRNSIYVSNLISKQDLQSRINEFNDLQNETKIKSLQLARNRNILIITMVTIGLMSIVLYSMYRQHLLRNDQKVLLLEQQALQSQMNPHFIFNALNSIKLYIINNEQKNAVYYLNKFSKLIRRILEVSKVREVSLKEELSTMNLYMSIENIRFSNSIDYIEKIDPNLNTDTIKIPPLVLQPFIENSIWHGLSSKEGKKEIILEAHKLNNKMIEINILDNGIGRDEADKIKSKKAKSLSRKSVGIDLTKERLHTFCSEFSEQFTLNYFDLVDDQGNANGTKASLKIPIQ